MRSLSQTEPQPFHWLVVQSRRVWLPDGTAAELGFHRFLFFSALFTYSVAWQPDVVGWWAVSDGLWRPTFFFGLLHLSSASEQMLTVLTWLWRASLFLAAAGLLTRLNTWTAFVLGFYLIGLPHNFSKVFYNDAFIVVGLLIFAASRCGDGWSLDSLLRTPGDRRKVEPAEYGWPLQLYRLMLTLVLFAAAMAKLRTAGTAWVLSDNLYFMIIAHFYTYHNPPTEIGLFFVRFPWICKLLAGLALSVEFSAPLLMLRSVWWRTAHLAVIVGMMVSFYLTLGVLVIEYIALLVIFFVPWQAVGARLVRRSNEPRLLVLYDGSCGLCQRTVAVIQAVDILGRVRIHDVLNEWAQLPPLCAEVNQKAGLETMHVVRSDGKIFTGFRAYRALAWQIPLGWPFVICAYLPGIAWVGERIYAAVAARRHTSGCPVSAP